MEMMYNMDKFQTLNQNEMIGVDGGVVKWTAEAAVALVVFCGAVVKTCFNAGRQFVRDIRNKWF